MLALFLLLAPFLALAEYKSELVLQDEKLVGEVVKTKMLYKAAKDLPKNYDLRPLGLLTQDLNQHIPVYCGSCWAHAAFSSIADRIKIATNGTERDIIPAIQVIINCGHAGSCNGGDSNAANAWVYKNGGVPDVTCQAYQAKNMECSDINTCMNCDHDPEKGCTPIKKYPKVTISEYGSVRGDDDIMSEIHARGPVSAYINAECIMDYTSGIDDYDTCNTRTTNHAIQINGWGEDPETGKKYWICRNSWGRYYGESGFFRIVRGGNWDVGKAFWAVPVIGGY